MASLLEPKLMTAEDYGRLPDDGRLTELVRGRFVAMNRPFTSHGVYVNRVGDLLTAFVEERGLGRIVAGEAGAVTHRDPDSVRGPDVSFYSYERIPRGPLPDGYWSTSPELVVEVRSESDRWKDILLQVAEYLNDDVLAVAVNDPPSRRVHVYSADHETTILSRADLLIFPAR